MSTTTRTFALNLAGDEHGSVRGHDLALVKIDREIAEFYLRHMDLVRRFAPEYDLIDRIGIKSDAIAPFEIESNMEESTNELYATLAAVDINAETADITDKLHLWGEFKPRQGLLEENSILYIRQNDMHWEYLPKGTNILTKTSTITRAQLEAIVA